MSTPEVAIIGAGLAGLTLALALHKQGINATIYESRSAPLNIGGAVMLSPNALKVLDALDLYQDVRGRGYNFDLLKVVKVDGELIETYEFGGKEKYGYQANRCYRYELIDVILSKIKSLGIPVVFGRKYARVVEETEDHVVWESTDGKQSTASFLVGADGIHSTVRKYLYPDVEPKFIGMAGITSAVPAGQVTYRTARLTSLLPSPLRAKKRIDELDREGWDKFLADKEGLVKFLQEDAEAFGEVAVTATSKIPHDKINVWPFYVIPHLDRWASQKRRVVILGDAAHAIPPSAGQGINQAFEDVYMFSLLLAAAKTGGVNFEDALTFWQGFRQDRVNKILELNKQIDLRRMPKGTRPAGLADEVVQKEFDLQWLYEPDFKAEVENWIRSTKS
ncbi:FAD binding domain-containing protein [Cladophialophora immunda]|nr:FAD binding domain-containing protein [Cladophialophora immunda]